MEATTAAIAVISLMLLLNVVTWDDITANKAAWNTLAWFATLVALADGLTRVGFVKWFAESVAGQLTGVSPTVAVAMLLLINFFGHYLFASVTAHVTAMIPVLLAVASTIPGVNMRTLALGLCLQLGIMGILTPYATGPSPVYYGSGYLPAADYWRLGAIFGVIFFVAFMVIGVPWICPYGQRGSAATVNRMAFAGPLLGATTGCPPITRRVPASGSSSRSPGAPRSA
jgi:L-tartrate/succinate antiporter